MQVAVKDQQDIYTAFFPCEEHVGKSSVKDDKQVEEEESLICTKRSQTIESLLPNEEDLFSGVLDEMGCTATANGNGDDFDLFNSNGGMELEGNSKLFRQQNSDYLISHEDDKVDDSKTRVLFEQHGHMYAFPGDAPIQANCCFTNSLPSVGMASIYNPNPSFHPHVWSFSNPFQSHHHINPVIWPHSPPYDNNISAHSLTNLHPEILPPIFTVSPIHNRQIIESCKNLQIGYMEESCRTPVQVVGFPSSKVSSPDSMIKSSRPRGRVRRSSHGSRHDTVSCHTDEKKYELDIERVLHGEDTRTTLMIKNIPNKYSSAMLLAAIDEHNQGTYDFIYLPLDFKNKCNMGYAFINIVNPLQIVQFYKSMNGKKWEKFHSGKVACLAYARIQGKAALIAHFQESSLMNEDKCCHPILFTTDGPNAGNQETFPLGPNIHSRRHKNRENQEISSTSCRTKKST